MKGTTAAKNAAALDAKAALDRTLAPRSPLTTRSNTGLSNSPIDQLSKMGPGLFLASAAIERNAKAQLKAEGITHVLQVGTWACRWWEQVHLGREGGGLVGWKPLARR